eukprot:TRINITY_DN1900_c0_g3_i1.p1 TRINITY_DN1900_c0_g3~~TRINITY_DN1900_c0_g3_i1.p1  ORF type:complete len:250 (+),score=38.47 TRINITY_DN1900_c0_g3_i1:82-831(+)
MAARYSPYGGGPAGVATPSAMQGYQDAILAAQYWAQQLNPALLAQLQTPMLGRGSPSPLGSPIIAGGKGGSDRCRFWGPGTSNDCRRGAGCPFRHDSGPQMLLAAGAEQSRYCRFYGPGTSNDCRRGDSCPFIHSATGDPGGKQRCRFWGPGTPNDCRRGDSCPFSHDANAPLGDGPGFPAQKPRCRYYPGDCRRGADCPYRHEDGLPGPSADGPGRCRFYGPGTPNDCRRGADCPFVHSDTPTGQQHL